MVAVLQQMRSTHRSTLWSLILLLFALAFLRSLAPERTEKAVRHLLAVNAGERDGKGEGETKSELEALKEDLQRERVALERWKDELDAQRAELEEMTVVPRQEQPAKTADEIGIMVDDEDLDAFTDVPPRDIKKGAEEGAKDGIEGERDRDEGRDNIDSEDGEDGDDGDEEGADEVEGGKLLETKGDIADEAAPDLGDEECPIIVIPESAKAGLGTQIEHIWSALSITLAVRNACMVVPPVVADDGSNTFAPVPFHEIFDAESLTQTGLRFVPLSTCERHGVSTVFDDQGAESAIVKSFAAFVHESHPRMAEESTLVHGDSTGHRFQDQPEMNGNVNIVAKYIRSKLPSEPGRHCVGLGRMHAEIEINPDVLHFFRSAASTTAYIEAKFADVDDILFVKLRWNRAHCDKSRTEPGTVCVFSDSIVPIGDYVQSIAYAAREAGAHKVYLSAPAHVPDEISEFISAHLDTLDPVLLDADGDFFAANILERELAVQAKRFVPDGGAWGQTVQLSRKTIHPDRFEENYSSLQMIEAWRSAGSPSDLPLLKVDETESHGEGGLPAEPDHAVRNDTARPTKQQTAQGLLPNENAPRAAEETVVAGEKNSPSASAIEMLQAYSPLQQSESIQKEGPQDAPKEEDINTSTTEQSEEAGAASRTLQENNPRVDQIASGDGEEELREIVAQQRSVLPSLDQGNHSAQSAGVTGTHTNEFSQSEVARDLADRESSATNSAGDFDTFQEGDQSNSHGVPPRGSRPDTETQEVSRAASTPPV